MPEYRHDPMTERIVIIAEERANRPHQFDVADHESVSSNAAACGHADCPFCEGNESQTPGEIDALRPTGSAPDSPGWYVRSVPNKYPAVTAETGQHEVIIDTPRHVLSIADLTLQELVRMLTMYRQRLAALRNHSPWAYAQIFKNVGAAAGASLPHSHSQLIAMPFISPTSKRTLRHLVAHYDRHRECCRCVQIVEELRHQERVVEETANFIVNCPFVSRFAGEVEISPKYHESAFDQIADQHITELAAVLYRTTRRLEKAVFWIKSPLAYNMVLNTEPFLYNNKTTPQAFHWNISILPSLARAAGFEWGTGLHINPVSPEQAARLLRETALRETEGT